MENDENCSISAQNHFLWLKITPDLENNDTFELLGSNFGFYGFFQNSSHFYDECYSFSKMGLLNVHRIIGEYTTNYTGDTYFLL